MKIIDYDREVVSEEVISKVMKYVSKEISERRELLSSTLAYFEKGFKELNEDIEKEDERAEFCKFMECVSLFYDINDVRVPRSLKSRSLCSICRRLHYGNALIILTINYVFSPIFKMFRELKFTKKESSPLLELSGILLFSLCAMKYIKNIFCKTILPRISIHVASGKSMEPTIHEGDYLIIDLFDDRIKVGDVICGIDIIDLVPRTHRVIAIVEVNCLSPNKKFYLTLADSMRANSNEKRIDVIPECMVIGKVVKVIKKGSEEWKLINKLLS